MSPKGLLLHPHFKNIPFAIWKLLEYEVRTINYVHPMVVLILEYVCFICCCFLKREVDKDSLGTNFVLLNLGVD